tara:strand:- start:101 stop:1138 length:1038 start_codon:yes stop_codon:yes gene_type:complete
MDDFVISNLHESRNEWCSRLVSILTPLVTEGLKSIFNESWKLCVSNDELNKYLMTFQNLLSRIPKWNNNIIEEEKNRIIERSGCNYLEDLITCVHIIQLKVLTCIRVGNKQKKIDISTPKLNDFIHKVYIHVARKVYSNIYLFEKNISPLLIQKNNRELELIIQESILIAIRESIPTESIIRAYMDESVEQEEEVIIETVNDDESEDNIVEPNNVNDNKENDNIKETNSEGYIEENTSDVVPGVSDLNKENVITKLSFNDIDTVLDEDNTINNIDAPKSIERLEQISTSNAIKKLDDNDDYDDDDEEERIQIHTDDIDLTGFDVLDSYKEPKNDDIILDDIEVLK